MHRRPAGRGRWLIGISAIALLVACVLQWWQHGGGADLPALTGNAFGAPVGGPGLIVFLIGVAALLLLTLPYASEHPVPVERPISYLLLFLVALVAYIWAVAILVFESIVPWPPLQGPGTWLAAIGLVGFARGVYELYESERPR